MGKAISEDCILRKYRELYGHKPPFSDSNGRRGKLTLHDLGHHGPYNFLTPWGVVYWGAKKEDGQELEFDIQATSQENLTKLTKVFLSLLKIATEAEHSSIISSQTDDLQRLLGVGSLTEAVSEAAKVYPDAKAGLKAMEDSQEEIAGLIEHFKGQIHGFEQSGKMASEDVKQLFETIQSIPRDPETYMSDSWAIVVKEYVETKEGREIHLIDSRSGKDLVWLIGRKAIEADEVYLGQNNIWKITYKNGLVRYFDIQRLKEITEVETLRNVIVMSHDGKKIESIQDVRGSTEHASEDGTKFGYIDQISKEVHIFDTQSKKEIVLDRHGLLITPEKKGQNHPLESQPTALSSEMVFVPGPSMALKRKRVTQLQDPHSIYFTEKGQWADIRYGYHENQISIMVNVHTGENLTSITGKRTYHLAMNSNNYGFSSSETKVALVNEKGEIEIWDLKNRRMLVGGIENLSDTRVEFTEDERFVIVRYHDHSIAAKKAVVVDLNTGTSLSDLDGVPFKNAVYNPLEQICIVQLDSLQNTYRLIDLTAEKALALKLGPTTWFLEPLI